MSTDPVVIPPDPPVPVIEQPSVGWGPTSKLLIGLVIAALIPVVEQTIEDGQLPTIPALIAAGLAVVLGILRVLQQVVLDKQTASVQKAQILASTTTTTNVSAKV